MVKETWILVTCFLKCWIDSGHVLSSLDSPLLGTKKLEYIRRHQKTTGQGRKHLMLFFYLQLVMTLGPHLSCLGRTIPYTRRATNTPPKINMEQAKSPQDETGSCLPNFFEVYPPPEIRPKETTAILQQRKTVQQVFLGRGCCASGRCELRFPTLDFIWWRSQIC